MEQEWRCREERENRARDEREIREHTHDTYMRASEFDPCPIQEPGGASAYYEEFTGGGQPPARPWNEMLNLEGPPGSPRDQCPGAGNQLVGGVESPPQMMPSRRTAEDIYNLSPESYHLQPPIDGEDVVETPPVASHAPSPLSEHQEILERCRRTLEMASRQYNITPSPPGPHPLEYGFSSQPQRRRQPLADLPVSPQPSPQGTQRRPGLSRSATDHVKTPPSRPTQSRPPPSGPPLTRSPPAPSPAEEPQLNYRSRLPPPSAACPPQSPPQRSRSAPPVSPPRTRATAPAPAQAPERPTKDSVRASIFAGTLKGTQEEMEAIGFAGQRNRVEMKKEYAFANMFIQPYRGDPPEIEQDEIVPTTGVLKREGTEVAGRKYRVMLKRKVVKITIPPRPEVSGVEQPYMYEPGDPQYGVSEGELLPPRRLSPSPPRSEYMWGGKLRTAQSLQSRRDLEADWERWQEATPSRECPGDRRPTGITLPKSFTTGKKHKPPQPTPSTSFGFAMGGRGCPQTPTTRTGLVLRRPGTPAAGTPPPRATRGAPPAAACPTPPPAAARGIPQPAAGRGIRPPTPTRSIPQPAAGRGICPPTATSGIRPPSATSGIRPPSATSGIRPPSATSGIRPPTPARGIPPPGSMQRGMCPPGSGRGRGGSAPS